MVETSCNTKILILEMILFITLDLKLKMKNDFWFTINE